MEQRSISFRSECFSTEFQFAMFGEKCARGMFSCFITWLLDGDEASCWVQWNARVFRLLLLLAAFGAADNDHDAKCAGSGNSGSGGILMGRLRPGRQLWWKQFGKSMKSWWNNRKKKTYLDEYFEKHKARGQSLCATFSGNLKKIGTNKFANAAYTKDSTNSLVFDLDVSMGKIVFHEKNHWKILTTFGPAIPIAKCPIPNA